MSNGHLRPVSPNDRCDKCGTPKSEWRDKPACASSLVQSSQHTITRFYLGDPNTGACGLCDRPLDETAQEASDGTVVHERCAVEYEDLIYFREFEGDEDA